MENSTTTTSNKITTSRSKGKERNDEDVPLFQTEPAYSCRGQRSIMRTMGSNATITAHPCEVSSNGLVDQGAHPLHSFHVKTFEEEKKSKARIARSKRQMARQTIRNLKQTSSINAPLSSPPSNSIRPRRTIRNRSSEVPHTIYSPDNVKLRFVLQKILTCSDVSDQGRIVLPKREAEDYLPTLCSKEGTLFIMKEVLSNTEWQVTYRFWANHKGRIYVLYNCGEFVSKNMLEVEDKLTLYQDVFKNVYFTITKKEKQMSSCSNDHDYAYTNSISMTTVTDRDEERSEANEEATSHTNGSYSTHRREKEPVTLQFF